MTNNERELRQHLHHKIEEAKKLLEDNKLEEARKVSDEAKQLRQQIDTLHELRDLADAPLSLKPVEEQRTKEPVYQDVFLKTLRHQLLSSDERAFIETRAMKGDVPEDGGLIIPQDIQTIIHEFKRAFVSLETLVTVEPVSTRSGSRVLEKWSEIKPFTEITEMENIPDIDSPKFKTIQYMIKDRAGILPVSNTLLADTDQNLISYLARWIAKKSTITRNKLILDLLLKLPKTEIKNLDDMKQIFNLYLDPSIALNATIVTNQDGYHFFDTMKDKDNRYLLQPDATAPLQKRLFGHPVVVIPNRFFPSPDKKIHFLMGDLKETIVLFDRQQYAIKSTDTGGKAFERNSTDIRVIQREDVKMFDEEATIYAELAVK